MSWYLAVLTNYVGFSGRARRKEFWMFTLIHVIIYVALIVIGAATDIDAIRIVAIAYLIALIIPTLAVAVRRLHDTGKSGAWYFIVFVPFIGSIWLLILLAGEGNQGANQYGPDPKAVTA